MKFCDQIIRSSVVSERSYVLSERGVYTLKVDPKASKHDIKKALKFSFDVDVVKINTSITRGKIVKKSVGAKLPPITVKLSNYKKAFVTLKQGQSLPKFHDTSVPTMAEAQQ